MGTKFLLFFTILLCGQQLSCNADLVDKFPFLTKATKEPTATPPTVAPTTACPEVTTQPAKECVQKQCPRAECHEGATLIQDPQGCPVVCKCDRHESGRYPSRHHWGGHGGYGGGYGGYGGRGGWGY